MWFVVGDEDEDRMKERQNKTILTVQGRTVKLHLEFRIVRGKVSTKP